MNDEQRQELIRRLQQGEELSAEWARILFPPEKREYELVYHGKEREEDIVANTLAVPLQKIRAFGKNGDGWHNMLIFGDNLQVMKSLLDLKKSGYLCNADGTPGVRLVYIDPPFATKRDFVGSAEQKAYQDKIEGAQFIEFLRKRLVLLRDLMSPDGSIFVHLDVKKCHYMKAIMDEVFGEHLFQSEIIWKCSSAHSDAKAISAIHQNIFFYSRSAQFVYNAQFQDYDDSYLDAKYRHKDKNGRRYRLDNLTATGLKGGGYRYRWNGVTKTWRCPISTMRDLEKRGRIRYTKNGTAEYVRYLDEMPGLAMQDLWADINPVNSQAIERIDYPTQKPEALLERILKACSNTGDLVLDAFAGSGTTCAVAEKLQRRWVGIDCGKLSIYTVQKRMFNLRKNIGNKGEALTPKPFCLYNAGLYDFTKLKELSWDAWRFFALQLFQCRDQPHRIGGIQLDGYLKGSSVLVFNHQKQPGVRIDEESVQSMHEALGSKIGGRMFIVAPALVFDFQQDYLMLDGVRYYALRIPYSIIHELHQREFSALKQPADELAVNDTVDAVGFDFVRSPELEYEAGAQKRKDGVSTNGFIKIKTFKSDAVVREPMRKKGNRETLSMVMVDYDFDSDSDVFDLDAVFYADAIEKAGWELRFPVGSIGRQIMAVFVDIYGNEAREVIPASKFGASQKVKAVKPAKKAPAKKKK